MNEERRKAAWTHVRIVNLVAIASCIALLTACSQGDVPVAPVVDVPRLGLVQYETEKAIPDAEFEAADENASSQVCVKGTPSGHLLYRDDNTATPSQPCPPSYQYSGKGGAVKVPAEAFTEDENGNAVVCWREVRAGSYIIKDDNLNTPSQPCPPSFYVSTNKKAPAAEAVDVAEADNNGNLAVCMRIIDGSNNFILKDDNPATPSQPCPPAFGLIGSAKY